MPGTLGLSGLRFHVGFLPLREILQQKYHCDGGADGAGNNGRLISKTLVQKSAKNWGRKSDESPNSGNLSSNPAPFMLRRIGHD